VGDYGEIPYPLQHQGYILLLSSPFVNQAVGLDGDSVWVLELGKND